MVQGHGLVPTGWVATSSPSTEMIKEVKETVTPSPTPRRTSIGKAAKAISKVGDIARKIKRENSKPEDENTESEEETDSSSEDENGFDVFNDVESEPVKKKTKTLTPVLTSENL